MNLPRKNATVTVRLSETDTTRPTLTGVVATVSKTHGEFSIIVAGRPQWFGAESVVTS